MWSVDNINDDAVFDDDRTIERPTFIDDRSTFDDCSHGNLFLRDIGQWIRG